MSHWAPEYCLSCDRQTDGSAYCSESCRLSDYEKGGAPHSTPSSPSIIMPSNPLFTSTMSSTTRSTAPFGVRASGSLSPSTTPREQSKFYLSPAYDFSNPSPYGTTPPTRLRMTPAFPPRQRQQSEPHWNPPSAHPHRLSPSTSHSSLCSMQSSSSTSSYTSTDTPKLSEKATRELREYASSFEQVLSQRRRSY